MTVTDEVRGYLDYVARIDGIMARKEQLERILAAGEAREDTALAIRDWMGESDHVADCMAALLFALIDRDRLLRKVNRRARHLLEDGE